MGGPDANASDAGEYDAGPPDSGVVPCDPTTDLADLYAWYVGDRGVSTDASGFTWLDQSPNHNDMTGALGPTIASGAANGHDAIGLLGASLANACGACPVWDTGSPFLASVVYRVHAASDGTIWNKGVALTHGLSVGTHAVDLGIEVDFSSDVRTLPPVADVLDEWHVVTVHYDGRIIVDGSIDSHLSFVVNDGTTNSLQVFGALGLGPFDGEIAELVVFHAQNPGNPLPRRACVEAYLMQRYGITP